MLSENICAFIRCYLEEQWDRKVELEKLVTMVQEKFASVSSVPPNALFYRVRYVYRNWKVSEV